MCKNVCKSTPASGKISRLYPTSTGVVYRVRLNKVVCFVIVGFQGLIVSGCLGPGYASAPPVITTQPADETVTTGQSATFVVQAAGAASLSYVWLRNGVAIPGATAANYTTAPSTIGDDKTTFQVEVANGLGKVTSIPASLAVHDPTDVLTWHNDNARTGQNLGETFL